MKTNTSSLELPASEVLGMLSHWAGTRRNGYTGLDYGYRDRLLQLVSGSAHPEACQEVLAKLLVDLPYFAKRTPAVSWRAGIPVLEVHCDDIRHQVALTGANYAVPRDARSTARC